MLSQSREHEDFEHPVGQFRLTEPVAGLVAVCPRDNLALLMQTSPLNGPATEQEPAASRRPPRGSRILLVDDQKSVREAINFLLKLDHHTVIEAADGSVALGLLMQGHFDLVITDFEMPNMKGNELAARIKQASPTQPILMITAYAERLRDSDNQVDAILDKPFRLEDLRQVMAELLS